MWVTMHRMPTHKPRLTVTLEPGTSARLAELSRLTGDSQSAIIADMLEKSSPVFDRVITVLKAAEAAKVELSERMAVDLEKAQGKIERQLGLALDVFEDHTAPLLEAVEAVRRRSRRAAVDGRSPASAARRERPTPISNRGVRSSPPTTKVRKKGV